MDKYIDEKCPVCDSRFSETDDVVVCPVCGTPHHRSCYAENKDCANKHLHNEGFVWKPENIGDSSYGADRLARLIEETDALRDFNVDGKMNGSFDNAGENNSENHRNNVKAEDKNDLLMKFRRYVMMNEQNLSRQNQEEFDELRKRALERVIFGVSEQEIVHFQGGVVNPYLIAVYRNMAEKNRVLSLNLFAAFLSPLYQFYHRMRSAGIILSVVAFVTLLPATVSGLVLQGILPAEAMPNAEFLSSISLKLNILSTVVFLGVSLLYDYFYLRWMTGRIKSIRAKFETEGMPLDEEYYLALNEQGRGSVLYMLLDTLIVMTALMLITFFIFRSAL
jgi:hypothetical protein